MLVSKKLSRRRAIKGGSMDDKTPTAVSRRWLMQIQVNALLLSHIFLALRLNLFDNAGDSPIGIG
jgi:hypothetical protein